jgi:ElaB/YqjD/DUF883 family membrane-anchored ribosome-binding protein
MTPARDNGGNDVRNPEILRAEADIARTRETVTRSVMALQQEISRRLDWREWIRQRPLLAVGLSFSVGALLGCWRHGQHRKCR